MTVKKKSPRCFICGCTEARACPEGCWWILKNKLCSSCHVGDLKIVQGLVALWGARVGIKEAKSWTYLVRARVVDYCRAVHLQANDNKYIRVPRMPRVLKALKPCP